MKLFVLFLVLFFTDRVAANEKVAAKTSIRALLKYPFAYRTERLIRKKIRKYALVHYTLWSGERYLKGKVKKTIWKRKNSRIYSEFTFRPDQQIFCEWNFTF